MWHELINCPSWEAQRTQRVWVLGSAAVAPFVRRHASWKDGCSIGLQSGAGAPS